MNGSSLKKYLVGFSIVVVFALYFIFVKTPQPSSPTTEPITQASSTNSADNPISDAAQGLSFGSRGTNVSALQQLLINEGYLTAISVPTGYFGPLTQAALEKSQGAIPAQNIGQYKDGTYIGSVADAFYGKIQVQVTIQNSMITNVNFLQTPSGGHSSDVTNMAEPLLTQEAISAQSANVNTVSGATQDSEAFNQSLAVALAMAKN